MSDKYEQLKVAVQDLLCELRIGPHGLMAMAEGYSPDYPGYKYPCLDTKHSKVLISKVVAQKLIDADVLVKTTSSEESKSVS